MFTFYCSINRLVIHILFLKGCPAQGLSPASFGSDDELRPGILDYMQRRGYVLESEEEGKLCFRRRTVVDRLARSFEDRITLTRNIGGFDIEGPNRDVVRILYGLEHALKQHTEE